MTGFDITSKLANNYVGDTALTPGIDNVEPGAPTNDDSNWFEEAWYKASKGADAWFQNHFPKLYAKFNPGVGGVESLAPGVNGAGVGSAFDSDAAKADFLDYLKNLYSGNLDYQRTLDLLNREQTFNRIEAQKARDWQQWMSGTAYQRAATDLKAAGFNPALIVGQGGAYVGSAAKAESTQKNVIAAGSQMTSLLSTVISSAFDLIQTYIDNVVPDIKASVLL